MEILQSTIDSDPTLTDEGKARVPRSKWPVFVLGCPRSGTTLLYDLLVSSGGFAAYPLESGTFRMLAPKFPQLNSVRSRRKLLDFWFGHEVGIRSELERGEIEARVLSECSHMGDFLRIAMEELCHKQGANRWTEKTPEHVACIPLIRQFFPESLFIHIIRDGRDVALSLVNFGRMHPFIWEAGSQLLSFGAYWKWLVQKGCADGRKLRRDYYEMSYEELVENPRESLAKLGAFIEHDMEDDRILRNGVGSVRRPNSSFRDADSAATFSPIARWRNQYSPEQLAMFEALAGDCLEEHGYKLVAGPVLRRHRYEAAAISTLCTSQLALKNWLLYRTPLGRFTGWRGDFPLRDSAEVPGTTGREKAHVPDRRAGPRNTSRG
jgi:Sulfotransferase family